MKKELDQLLLKDQRGERLQHWKQRILEASTSMTVAEICSTMLKVRSLMVEVFLVVSFVMSAVAGLIFTC